MFGIHEHDFFETYIWYTLINYFYLHCASSGGEIVDFINSYQVLFFFILPKKAGVEKILPTTIKSA